MSNLFSKPLTVYVENNHPKSYDLVQKAVMPLLGHAGKFQNSCNVIQRETGITHANAEQTNHND